jgi:hypothetical protein
VRSVAKQRVTLQSLVNKLATARAECVPECEQLLQGYSYYAREGKTLRWPGLFHDRLPLTIRS